MCGKGESRCRQEQTQAEPEWDSANDGDDRDRSHGTRHSWRESVACLNQDRPDLQICVSAGLLRNGKAHNARHGSRQEHWAIIVGKPRARCWFRCQQSGELKAYSDAYWGGDKATPRSVSAGVML